MSCRHLLAANLAALLFVSVAAAGTAPHRPVRFIVQAPTALAAHQYVERAGARVERDLPIINGVSAFLDPWEVTRLRATAGVRVYEDRALAPQGLLNLLSPVTAPGVQVVTGTTTPKNR